MQCEMGAPIIFPLKFERLNSEAWKVLAAAFHHLDTQFSVGKPCHYFAGCSASCTRKGVGWREGFTFPQRVTASPLYRTMTGP